MNSGLEDYLAKVDKWKFRLHEKLADTGAKHGE